jgi:hypothetical protein
MSLCKGASKVPFSTFVAFGDRFLMLLREPWVGCVSHYCVFHCCQKSMMSIRLKDKEKIQPEENGTGGPRPLFVRTLVRAV